MNRPTPTRTKKASRSRGWLGALLLLVGFLAVGNPPARAQPPNDDFPGTTISGRSGSVAGTNVGATKQTGEPGIAGNAGGASIWYTWTAPTTGGYSFDTCGSDFDTLLAVYSGDTVDALTE